ncbi:MAG: DICT sensory domain-containing protein [Microcoleaceae cyanobacterium]
MSISISVLSELTQAVPQLRPQIYFKSSLVALSHAMEDQVLASDECPLVIATFQRERFYRQEAHRYCRIAARSSHVYVMAAPETEFKNASKDYETIAFTPQDELAHEWNLVVLGQSYATCLVCTEKEHSAPDALNFGQLAIDQARPFEGIWTSHRPTICRAAELLLKRILYYRPELTTKVERAIREYDLTRQPPELSLEPESLTSPQNSPGDSQAQDCVQFNDPFTYRLVNYLQAGQHKLLRVYRSLAAKERKERLVNLITAAIRQSLNPKQILKAATDELGEAMAASRCLIYRCRSTDTSTTIRHEFLRPSVSENSILPEAKGKSWALQKNPLFQAAIQSQTPTYCPSVAQSADELGFSAEQQKKLNTLAQKWQIQGWLMMPISYQGRLLGMVELHQCQTSTATLLPVWQKDELALVDAIASQLAAALIQAETHANLEDLNQQLEALDRTRSNLIAITGHELRTPLSTIQVCLESLFHEPDMPVEMRQVMLETAMADADRMRKLVQDFLTLSNLESGRVDWNLEVLPLQECVDLALSGIRARYPQASTPQVNIQVPPDLPLVRADGEWLVELLSKLLDNAHKFTDSDGTVTIRAKRNGSQMLEVIVEDTGRGIEPDRLEAVFDRFYQEEGSLQRTVGGTGLGLAIGKQIVSSWGGQIWADSAGKNRGSQFHFTIPFIEPGVDPATVLAGK